MIADGAAVTQTRRSRFRLTAAKASSGYEPSESAAQIAVMRWSAVAIRQWPELRWLFAVPNGPKLELKTARLMVAMGLKAGVMDLILPIARDGCIGLGIEMKVKKRKPTDAQREWLEGLRAHGWRTVVCNGIDEAIDTLRVYLSARKTEFR